MVLRLNGGGDFTADGPVDVPDVDVVGVPPVVGVVVDDVRPGDTSGENTAPRAEHGSLRPYVFARVRWTSRISTSTTISARGLSFCVISLSMICATALVARTVIVLLVLLNCMIGCTGMAGSPIN